MVFTAVPYALASRAPHSCRLCTDLRNRLEAQLCIHLGRASYEPGMVGADPTFEPYEPY